jgi:hypothetical protein
VESSEQNFGGAAPDLTPDAVVTDATAVEDDAVVLVGYLGEGCSGQSRRLYETIGLNRWIEIRVEDIVKRDRSPTSGQNLIWVKREASLALCQSVRASSYEQPPPPPDGGPGPLPSAWPRP